MKICYLFTDNNKLRPIFDKNVSQTRVQNSTKPGKMICSSKHALAVKYLIVYLSTIFNEI
jgi:hypothetical protein